MPFGVVALGALAGGALGAVGSMRAAKTQAGATDRATQAQLEMFRTINEQQAPWRQAGSNALTQIGRGFGPDTSGGVATAPSGDISSGYFTHAFTPADLTTNLAPSYNFMLQQGLGATQNALNAGGGNISGNTLRGMTQFAEDYAKTGYQQAFENYQANQTNIFNRLATIAGLGQTAGATTAGAGASLGASAAQTMAASGAARGAGIVGAANALSGAGSSAASWYAMPAMINAFKGGATDNLAYP